MTTRPRNWIRRTVRFPDPVEQAQVVFSRRPEDMRRAYEANQSFLQTCSDYKNMMSGVDLSNQRLFQSVTNTMKRTSLPALLGNKEDTMKFLTDLKLMSEQPEFTAIMKSATPMLEEVIKVVKDDPQFKEILKLLKIQTPETTATTSVSEAVTWTGIPRSVIDKFFADADLKETTPFEITNHGGDWFMGVGKDLDSKSYFRLLPLSETENVTSIEAVNDRNQQRKEFVLSLEFCKVLILNTVTEDNKVKDDYLALLHHCYGDKLGDKINQFRTGQVAGFPTTEDEDMVEENKLEAAKMVDTWYTRSVKFREWIAPTYQLNIEGVKKFLKSLEASDVSEIPETPRMELRSDTRRKAALDESAFRTPMPVKSSDVMKSESSYNYKLSPEGREVLTDYMKRGTNKKKAKEEIKKMAEEDPVNYGHLVKKKGEGMKIKKILVPPNKLARLERVKVILGALDADSTANYLEEYTVIVDSLLQDKMITSDQHKYLVKKYFDILNDR